MRNTVLKLGCFVLLFGVAACSDTSSEPGPSTGGTAGTGGAGGSTAACGDEVKACDPFYKNAQGDCSDTRQTCHAKSDGTTICACQSDTPGPQNAPCFSGPGDCQQGFVCVSDTCKTLCDPAAAPTTCEGALPCKKLGSSSYGNCDS